MIKKVEIGLIGLFVIALVLHILHLPGSALLLILSLGILAILYFLFGVVLFNNQDIKGRLNELSENAYKRPNIGAKFKNIGIGVVFTIAVEGILFKLLSWPGANILLIFGIVGLSIVTVISVRTNSKDKASSDMLKRIILFGGLGVFLFLIPTKTWLNFTYPDNPEYVQAVLDYQENPTNKELKEKVDIESAKLRD